MLEAQNQKEEVALFHIVGYNRPENLWKDFAIESKSETMNSRGRSQDKYETANPKYINAILCGASPKQVLEFQQAGHPITHVISHKGNPQAKAGDRLIFQERAFYVQGVDNPGELGVWTLYYCEERSGAHDGSQLG